MRADSHRARTRWLRPGARSAANRDRRGWARVEVAVIAFRGLRIRSVYGFRFCVGWSGLLPTTSPLENRLRSRKPLPHGRGSDQSPERQRGVAGRAPILEEGSALCIRAQLGRLTSFRRRSPCSPPAGPDACSTHPTNRRRAARRSPSIAKPGIARSPAGR